MAGLARIAKLYGGMKVTSNGKTTHYVWDYVADEAVTEDEMPLGSERHAASERKLFADLVVTPQGKNT